MMVICTVADLRWDNQWILNKRWSIEAAIGAGYARVHYDKYNCGECGSKIETKNSNYWGVTKAALSIILFYPLKNDLERYETFIEYMYRFIVPRRCEPTGTERCAGNC